MLTSLAEMVTFPGAYMPVGHYGWKQNETWDWARVLHLLCLAEFLITVTISRPQLRNDRIAKLLTHSGSIQMMTDTHSMRWGELLSAVVHIPSPPVLPAAVRHHSLFLTPLAMFSGSERRTPQDSEIQQRSPIKVPGAVSHSALMGLRLRSSKD